MQKFFVIMLLEPVEVEKHEWVAQQLFLLLRVEVEKVERVLETSGVVAVVQSLEKAQRVVKVLQGAGLSVALLEPPLEDADVEVPVTEGKGHKNVSPIVSRIEDPWDEFDPIVAIVGGFIVTVLINIILLSLFGGGLHLLFLFKWIAFGMLFGFFGWSSVWSSMSIMLLLWPVLMSDDACKLRFA